jgi:hypothetical protein
MFYMPSNCIHNYSAHNEKAKILCWIVNCELQYIFYLDASFRHFMLLLKIELSRVLELLKYLPWFVLSNQVL